MRIGILALQGALEPHRLKLAELGAEPVLVRSGAELAGCAGLILPGGESTTLLKLIGIYGLGPALLEFARERPVFGVCAGAILMAEKVENPSQRSLGLIPATVRRNAYGRQNESFIGEVSLTLPAQKPASQEGVFIRAPRLLAWARETTVVASCNGEPVALQHAHHLVCTFHPELSAPHTLHRHFLALCREKNSRETA